MTDVNVYLNHFTLIFEQVLWGKLRMEDARDQIRLQLHKLDQIAFPITEKDGTDLYKLCTAMLQHNKDYLRCNLNLKSTKDNITLWDCTKSIWKESPYQLGPYKDHNISECLNLLLLRKTSVACPQCKRKLAQRIQFDHLSQFMTFVTNGLHIELEQTIQLSHDNSEYKLCDIIYYGQFHFTSRIISVNGDIWYNDGMTTGTKSILEGNLSIVNKQTLLKVHGKKCSVMIYVKVQWICFQKMCYYCKLIN